MILSDRRIYEFVKKGEIKINPFYDDAVGPACYEMRIGRKALGSKSGLIENIEERGGITVKPNEFLEFLTFEELELSPRVAAIVGLKFSIARKGLIPITGPLIDPGFKGKIMFAVFNPLPIGIRLNFFEKVLKVIFFDLSEDVLKPYDGKFQNQIDIPKEDLEYFREIWRHYAERY